MSNPPDKSFADHLIAADSVSPELRERYKKQIQTLVELRYTPARRWLAAFLGITWLVIILVCGLSNWETFRTSNSPLLGFLLLGSVSAVSLLAFFLIVAIRGRIRRLTGSALMLIPALITVGGVGALLLHLGWATDDTLFRQQLTFGGSTMLILAGAVLAFAIVEDMNTRNREHLLRIELALADLADQLKRSTGHGAT